MAQGRASALQGNLTVPGAAELLSAASASESFECWPRCEFISYESQHPRRHPHNNCCLLRC